MLRVIAIASNASFADATKEGVRRGVRVPRPADGATGGRSRDDFLIGIGGRLFVAVAPTLNDCRRAVRLPEVCG